MKLHQPEAHLLVVDDDDRIRDLLQKFLIKSGFLISSARNAAQASKVLAGLEFDMIILDVMMPGEDGIALTKRIRQNNMTPILLLTAKNDTQNRIKGLEAGADDYLAKPFDPKELLLRINAILRRVPRSPDPILPKVIRMGKVRYDVERGELWHNETLVRLTTTEALLMRLFASQPGRPISRERLVSELGRNDMAQERAIDVQITRLRRKTEEQPKLPRYLQTVRGEGYMLQPD